MGGCLSLDLWEGYAFLSRNVFNQNGGVNVDSVPIGSGAVLKSVMMANNKCLIYSTDNKYFNNYNEVTGIFKHIIIIL